MYLAIDVGGTKTLIGLYGESGKLQSKVRIETSSDYQEFIESIKNNKPDTMDGIKKCVVGVPGLINRERGIVHALGNLPWRDEPIRDDTSAAIGGVDTLIENDARLAGLAEAIAISPPRSRVLYLTISTGIGGALIVDKKIVRQLQDAEMGHMPLYDGGKITSWEYIASGKAVVERYGMKAADITDPGTWQEIGEKIAYGVGALCAVLQPEAIVFGGGVGQFADKFIPSVQEYLKEHLQPVVVQPETLQGPKYGEDNVLRGCYELAVQS
jgi:glucokinase